MEETHHSQRELDSFMIQLMERRALLPLPDPGLQCGLISEEKKKATETPRAGCLQREAATGRTPEVSVGSRGATVTLLASGSSVKKRGRSILGSPLAVVVRKKPAKAMHKRPATRQ